jgi:hypothetical protein
MTITVLDPTQEPVLVDSRQAPRLPTLDGQVIGLYSNGKTNASKLLAYIGEELERRFELPVPVRGTYQVSRVMEPDEWQGVDQCDAVILAVGDCGSCSSSGVLNCIQLEQKGIPAVLVSTPPFAGVCRTMARLGGRPDLRWIVADHPIGSLDAATLRTRARVAADQFYDIVVGST